MTNIVVIGMGYPSTALRTGSGIPCAALFADVPGFSATGVQRRSLRSQDTPKARRPGIPGKRSRPGARHGRSTA
jgi:hypothetical protein